MFLTTGFPDYLTSPSVIFVFAGPIRQGHNTEHWAYQTMVFMGDG